MNPTKHDIQTVEGIFNKIKTKGRRCTRKEKNNKVVANGLRLGNKFETLEEEDATSRLDITDQQKCDKTRNKKAESVIAGSCNIKVINFAIF